MRDSFCTCPDCDARIRLAADRPAGKPVRCPNCNTVFSIPEPEEAFETQGRRGSRRRIDPTDGDAERRPRERKQTASAGMQPATLATILVSALVGTVLLLAGGAWLLVKGLKSKEEVVAGSPGKAKSVSPAPPSVPRGTQVGNMAQEIEGEDIDGHRFRLSEYQGKVVLLDFWGNW